MTAALQLTAIVRTAVEEWNAQHPDREPLFLPLSLRVAIGVAVADAVLASWAGRRLPGSWWISNQGLDECVWRPGERRDRPVVVAMKHTTDPALWAALVASLPHRGDCVVCTAIPCPTHAVAGRASTT